MGLEWKSRKSRDTWSNRQIWPWSAKLSRAKANRVLLREWSGHSKHPLPKPQETTVHMGITKWSTPISRGGDGAPLQHSRLENPMGGGAWWAAVHGVAKSDMTEWLHFRFSLSCIGEGNGNPLQCSCLENPRDGGAWWAAVSEVAQSRTQLKWLSSNTEIRLIIFFAAKDGEALYSQQKQDQELTVVQIMNSLLQNSYLNWRK